MASVIAANASAASSIENRSVQSVSSENESIAALAARFAHSAYIPWSFSKSMSSTLVGCGSQAATSASVKTAKMYFFIISSRSDLGYGLS